MNKQKISPQTSQLIKDMMKQAKLSYKQQQKLDEYILQGRLPDPAELAPQARKQGVVIAQKPSKFKLTRHMRTFDQIVASGVFDSDPGTDYRPKPSKNYQIEKTKLQKKMAGVVDSVEQPKPVKKEQPIEDINEFDMRKFFLILVLSEIAERKDFLDELESLGQLSDFHRQKIHTEISQRVSKLEKLHKIDSDV